jgi:hypothetical protein
MDRSMRTRLLPAVLLAAFLSAPSPARAQGDDAERRALAQTLFDQATKLMDHKDFAAACPKLEEILRMYPTKIGTMLTLGECFEGAGRFASAWTEYRAAADAAAAQNDARTAEARSKATAVEGKLARLRIVVSAAAKGTAGLTVQRNGITVGAALWGDPIPVDPGAQAVVVTAPGKQTWRGSVDAKSGASVTIEVPALAAATAEPSPAPPLGAPAPAQPPPAAEGGGRPAWAWALGGVGVAALGVGVGFGVDGLLAQSTLSSKCPGLKCTMSAVPPDQLSSLNGRKDRGLAIFLGMGGAGVVALSVAIVGLARAPKASSTEKAMVVPLLGPGVAGAALHGRF